MRQPKFDFNSSVYMIVENDDDYTEVECPECNDGKLTGKTGKLLRCANCDGAGVYRKYGESFKVVGPVMPTGVNIDNNNSIVYFFDDGGLKFESPFEEDLFATKEKAIAEWAEKNGASLE